MNEYKHPFACFVANKKRKGHYIVHTIEGKRYFCANMQTARTICLKLNIKNKDWR